MHSLYAIMYNFNAITSFILSISKYGIMKKLVQIDLISGW